MRPGHGEGRQAAPTPCRSRSRTSRPSRNASSSSSPGRTWSPSWTRPTTPSAAACSLPGFRPGKVPRALLEKMYQRQVEDEVARDLVEHSIGQAIRENQIQPVAPPTVDELEIKSGAPFKFTARVEVRSQVDAQGLRRAAPDAPARQGDRRGDRGGAGGLPAPADRVQAGRGAPADQRHRPRAGRAVRAGGRPQAQEAPGRHRPGKRRRGPAAGPGQPPARQADRRRPRRGRLHASG